MRIDGSSIRCSWLPFQIPGDSRIQIPLGASVEGVITSDVEVTGNLNAQSAPPVAQLIRSSETYTVGGANISGSDLLNSADSTTTPYVVGDQIIIAGMQSDGSQQVFTELDVTPATRFRMRLMQSIRLFQQPQQGSSKGKSS